MKSVQIIIISFVLLLTACHHPKYTASPEKIVGQLRVGFDVDDTILFSRDNFLKALSLSDDSGHLDYGWINMHDSVYSVLIDPVAELIGFLRAHGHEVYFITARPGTNGEAVGRYLSKELGFPIVKGQNLFFSPKEKDKDSGYKYTTKHELITKLGLHIFYGDSDNDMVAASVAGIRGVRVVRDARSIEDYSPNYFGDIKADSTAGSPYSEAEYKMFLIEGVGPYGETIFPIRFISK